MAFASSPPPLDNGPPDPVPTCPLCQRTKGRGACAFHAARTPAALGAALLAALRKRAAKGLASFLVASFAAIDSQLPPAVASGLATLDPKPLWDRWAEIADQEQLTPDDLREHAAVALAIALIAERSAADDSDDDEDDDAQG